MKMPCVIKSKSLGRFRSELYSPLGKIGDLAQRLQNTTFDIFRLIAIFPVNGDRHILLLPLSRLSPEGLIRFASLALSTRLALL